MRQLYRFTEYKGDPDTWVNENIGQIMAWAQFTYKTTYETADMIQAAHLSVIIANSVVSEKKLTDQKSFRAAFIYSLRNNRPVGFYDTPFSSIDDDFVAPMHCYELEPNLAASNISSTIIDVLEKVWPSVIDKIPKKDVELLTTVLGLGDHGQLSCREAAAVLAAPKTTISRHTNSALKRLLKIVTETVPELRP